MRIETYQLGSFMTNAYLVLSGDGREALLVDAPEEIEQVIDRCDADGLVPRMLINTHGHVDHIAGNQAVKARWPDIRVAIHPADARKLESPMRNLSLLMGMRVKSPAADVMLREGDQVRLGNETFDVLETPGHTPGGITLVARPDDGPAIAITGDTLFYQGVGRTDFPGGDMQTLLETIRRKLFTLPDDTICYPGHGPSTMVGQERESNPFL